VEEELKEKIGVGTDGKGAVKLVWFGAKAAERNELEYKGEFSKDYIQKFVNE
jgi:hypothetical protein